MQVAIGFPAQLPGGDCAAWIGFNTDMIVFGYMRDHTV
jgi:hypothetical protein